jgi:hypothetical protein
MRHILLTQIFPAGFTPGMPFAYVADPDGYEIEL